MLAYIPVKDSTHPFYREILLWKANAIKFTFPLNFGFGIKINIFEAGITVYYWEWSVFRSGRDFNRSPTFLTFISPQIRFRGAFQTRQVISGLTSAIKTTFMLFSTKAHPILTNARGFASINTGGGGGGRDYLNPPYLRHLIPSGSCQGIRQTQCFHKMCVIVNELL